MAALHELLAKAADDTPDNIAVIAPQTSVTYKGLHQNALKVAATLIESGTKPGDVVGVSLPKSVDSIIAVYGIMFTGACYVPIDPFSPSDRMVQIAENVDMSRLITTFDRVESLANAIALVQGEMLVLTPTVPSGNSAPHVRIKHWYDAGTRTFTLPIVEAQALAYVLHTSGSTGVPKGVAISHKSSLTFVKMAAEFFSITDEDRLCSQAPLHFDLSVFDVFVACRQGAAIVLIPEFYSAFPKKMVEAIQEHKITVWNSVVSALTLMMERGDPEPGSFNSIRIVLFSGEAMPIKYLRKLKANITNATLFNGYGQTEANTSTYYRVDTIPDTDDWKIPIGKAFPCYDVFALDDEGRKIETGGNEGELYVRSDAVAEGYWGQPESTAERFLPDHNSRNSKKTVFRTGDRVSLDAAGNYHFIGRADDMVKSRGYRIELGEIEQILLSLEGVEFAACIALPDLLIGNKIVAFVSPSSGVQLDNDTVVAHCRRHLATYMVPESVNIWASLPKTSTGKIDRSTLNSKLTNFEM